MSAHSRIRAVAKFFFEGDRKFFIKGVTYGPFKPDAEGHYLGKPEQVDADLGQMRQIGINVLRIYHAPPRWFLDKCADAGMRVLITLPPGPALMMSSWRTTPLWLWNSPPGLSVTR